MFVKLFLEFISISRLIFFAVYYPGFCHNIIHSYVVLFRRNFFAKLKVVAKADFYSRRIL